MGKNQDPGSGINIPDPPHWLLPVGGGANYYERSFFKTFSFSPRLSQVVLRLPYTIFVIFYNELTTDRLRIFHFVFEFEDQSEYVNLLNFPVGRIRVRIPKQNFDLNLQLQVFQ
jgi:hypothetical protein